MNKENAKKLDSLGFFREEVERVAVGQCALCGEPVHREDFRDELSMREFNISGMCQKCQDKFFG
jgi:hypothetical protein